MVWDSIEYAAIYANLSPRIARALQFLRADSSYALPIGRHPIDGEKLFASVERYTTRPSDQCFWEAHRKYIDVQFIVDGIERIDWRPIDQLAVSEAYDPAKDRSVHVGTGRPIVLRAKHFAIFWPHDAHMPCQAYEQPTAVHKIVMKVAVD